MSEKNIFGLWSHKEAESVIAAKLVLGFSQLASRGIAWGDLCRSAFFPSATPGTSL